MELENNFQSKEKKKSSMTSSGIKKIMDTKKGLAEQKCNGTDIALQNKIFVDKLRCAKNLVGFPRETKIVSGPACHEKRKLLQI